MDCLTQSCFLNSLNRKLLLSIVGSFFGTKSPSAVATALLLSVAFLILHSTYHPYKSRQLNILQFCCLLVLMFFYFMGLLLKLDAVAQTDSNRVGVLLVSTLAMVLITVLVMVACEIWAVRKHILEKRKIDAKLDQHPEIFQGELQAYLINYDELKLVNVVDRGAYGTVRRGEWKRQIVAVKELNVFGSSSHSGVFEQIEEIKNEATILSRLRHAHVVDFFGVSFLNTAQELKLFIVMELCDRSLADDIFNEELPLMWAQKLQLLLNIAEGMQCMHEQGMVQ